VSEYGALDGKPVDTLFAMISPTTRAHLYLTAKLSFVLRDKIMIYIHIYSGYVKAFSPGGIFSTVTSLLLPDGGSEAGDCLHPGCQTPTIEDTALVRSLGIAP
jgi:hypothetical protein